MREGEKVHGEYDRHIMGIFKRNDWTRFLVKVGFEPFTGKVNVKTDDVVIGLRVPSSSLKLHPFTEKDREYFQSLLSPKASLLDVGSGPGYDAKYFCEKGFEVTGIDFSDTMISLASQRAPSAKFIKTDMRRLDQIKEKFDAIWSSFSFLHITQVDAARILSQFTDVLKDNGLIYICIRTQEITEWHKTKICELDAAKEKFLETYIQEWNQDEFLSVVKQSGFQLLEQRSFDRPGGTHPFLSMIAKKNNRETHARHKSSFLQKY